MFLLAAAAALVMVIVSVNLSNMILARSLRWRGSAGHSTRDDTGESPWVVIVNETAARTRFPDGEAIGLGLGARGARAAEVPLPTSGARARSGLSSGKKILLLGGTGFIGPYQVRSLLHLGHEVTLFNRGSRPGMFPGVEELRGDRNGDFESLRGRSWDVCIDNSTSRPDWVTSAGELLQDSVGLFYYVSSRSAYASHGEVPMMDGTDTVQVIDVRDLGDFMALSCAAGHTGQFNLVGPLTPRPMAEMVYGIRAVTNAETEFTWVDTDFLTERRIRGYAELPVWRPPVEGAEGFAKFDLSNEVAHGLTFRSLADTTEATLKSYFSKAEEDRPARRSALTLEREAEVLAEWHSR